jgi:hypothetical protein
METKPPVHSYVPSQRNPNATSPVTYNIRNTERDLLEKIVATKPPKERSKSAAVRDAIHLYAIAHQKLTEGKRIAFVDESGYMERIGDLWQQEIKIEPPKKDSGKAELEALLAACISINKSPDFEIAARHLGVETLVEIGKKIINK